MARTQAAGWERGGAWGRWSGRRDRHRCRNRTLWSGSHSCSYLGSWMRRWWCPHRGAALARSVGPPWPQGCLWCSSHQANGRSQPSAAHWSCSAERAMAWALVKSRWEVPRSRGSEAAVQQTSQPHPAPRPGPVHRRPRCPRPGVGLRALLIGLRRVDSRHRVQPQPRQPPPDLSTQPHRLPQLRAGHPLGRNPSRRSTRHVVLRDRVQLRVHRPQRRQQRMHPRLRGSA